MKDKLIRKILGNLKGIDKSKTYLVGLSGGADSVTLLRVLNSLNFNIVAAHVHHNLRKESDDELVFCKKLCDSLGVKFRSTKLTFSEDEQKNQNSYRVKRYAFFKKVYNEENAEGIFLGQHLDDQIENAVSSFFKRKSVLSLKAMSTSSEMDGMILYRPLLNVRKHEILEMSKRHNYDFVTDQSNFSTAYERNKVRLLLMPVVEQIFGKGVYKTLEELIVSSKEENETNEFYSKLLIEKYFRGNIVDLKCLEEHSIHIMIYAIDRILKRKGLNVDKASYNDLKNVIVNKKNGQVNVKGCTIEISKNHLKLIM